MMPSALLNLPLLASCPDTLSLCTSKRSPQVVWRRAVVRSLHARKTSRTTPAVLTRHQGWFASRRNAKHNCEFKCFPQTHEDAPLNIRYFSIIDNFGLMSHLTFELKDCQIHILSHIKFKRQKYLLQRSIAYANFR